MDQDQEIPRMLLEVQRRALDGIPAEVVFKVMRRVIDGESFRPRLDVAAFNSAP